MLKHIPFYASLLGKPLADGKTATHSHVLTYGAIEAHSLGARGCIASNKTLANEIGMAQKTASNAISDLRKAGWVKYDLDANNQRGAIEPMLTLELGVTPTPQRVTPYPPAGTPLPASGNIEYSLDNSLDKTIDKSIGTTYGSPDINDILIYWETVVGTPIMSQVKANRYAASNLLKKYGLTAVKQLVDAVARSKTDQYAPRISDFVVLQRRLNDLVEWARRKNSYANIEVI